MRASGPRFAVEVGVIWIPPTKGEAQTAQELNGGLSQDEGRASKNVVAAVLG